MAGRRRIVSSLLPDARDEDAREPSETVYRDLVFGSLKLIDKVLEATVLLTDLNGAR